MSEERLGAPTILARLHRGELTEEDAKAALWEAPRSDEGEARALAEAYLDAPRCQRLLCSHLKRSPSAAAAVGDLLLERAATVDVVVRVVEVIHTDRLCEHAALLEKALELPAFAHVKRRVLTECRERLARCEWQSIDVGRLEASILAEMTVEEVAALVRHLEGARKPLATRISLVDRLNIFHQSRDERRLASLERKLELGREALARRGAPAEAPPLGTRSESEMPADGRRCSALGARIGDLIGVTDFEEPDLSWLETHPDMCLEIVLPDRDERRLQKFRLACDHFMALHDDDERHSGGMCACGEIYWGRACVLNLTTGETLLLPRFAVHTLRHHYSNRWEVRAGSRGTVDLDAAERVLSRASLDDPKRSACQDVGRRLHRQTLALPEPYHARRELQRDPELAWQRCEDCGLDTVSGTLIIEEGDAPYARVPLLALHRLALHGHLSEGVDLEALRRLGERLDPIPDHVFELELEPFVRMPSFVADEDDARARQLVRLVELRERLAAGDCSAQDMFELRERIAALEDEARKDLEPPVLRGRGHGLSLAADGRLLAVGSSGGFVVYELPTWRPVLERPSEHEVEAIALSGDGRTVAIAEAHRLGEGVDPPKPLPTAPSGLTLPARGIAASWHPKRPVLAVACDDGRLHVLEWHEDAEYLELARTLEPALEAPIAKVQWTRDGGAIGCASAPGPSSVLELSSGEPHRGPGGPELCEASELSWDGRFRVRPIGHQLFVGLAGHGPDPAAANVWLCEVPSGELRGGIQTRHDVDRVQFSPDGTLLALMGHGWQIHDVATGWPLFDEHSRPDLDPRLLSNLTECQVSRVAFSPRGTSFATAGTSLEVALWRAPDGSFLRSVPIEGLTAHEQRVESLAFDPQGDQLAIGSTQGSIHLWDVHTGEIEAVLRAPRPLWQVAFSPDGSSLVSVCDREVRLWDLTTRPASVRARWPGGGKESCGVAFRPDGTLLVCGGADGNTVELRDRRTGREIHRWDGRPASRRA